MVPPMGILSQQQCEKYSILGKFPRIYKDIRQWNVMGKGILVKPCLCISLPILGYFPLALFSPSFLGNFPEGRKFPWHRHGYFPWVRELSHGMDGEKEIPMSSLFLKLPFLSLSAPIPSFRLISVLGLVSVIVPQLT